MTNSDDVVSGLVQRAEAAEKRVAELEAQLIDVTASLIAAYSLLSRSHEFDQMLVDYQASIDRARAILKEQNDVDA